MRHDVNMYTLENAVSITRGSPCGSPCGSPVAVHVVPQFHKQWFFEVASSHLETVPCDLNHPVNPHQHVPVTTHEHRYTQKDNDSFPHY